MVSSLNPSGYRGRLSGRVVPFEVKGPRDFRGKLSLPSPPGTRPNHKGRFIPVGFVELYCHIEITIGAIIAPGSASVDDNPRDLWMGSGPLSKVSCYEASLGVVNEFEWSQGPIIPLLLIRLTQSLKGPNLSSRAPTNGDLSQGVFGHLVTP